MFMFRSISISPAIPIWPLGLGRIFGFRYCENFDLPYISTSITEFWRRWHMSLGSFFRDYVYIRSAATAAARLVRSSICWLSGH